MGDSRLGFVSSSRGKTPTARSIGPKSVSCPLPVSFCFVFRFIQSIYTA